MVGLLMQTRVRGAYYYLCQLWYGLKRMFQKCNNMKAWRAHYRAAKESSNKIIITFSVMNT